VQKYFLVYAPKAKQSNIVKMILPI